jgi:hypothetical protein
MMTNTLKIKFSKTVALAAGASSLRRGIIADSTLGLFDGFFFELQLPIALVVPVCKWAIIGVQGVANFQVCFSNPIQ